MEGENHIVFTHLYNERYDITMPNVYARGILCKCLVIFFFEKRKLNNILVGKMVLELGDSCVVRCRTSDLVCELDFKNKVKNTYIFYI